MTLPAPLQREIDALVQRVELLRSEAAELRREIAGLRGEQARLSEEKAGLLAKSEQARSRVEAMILRLRALEQAP